MLELSSISKSFADALVLDNLNLAVAPGSRTAIVGPSGSGKTTLLRILAGFETPDNGRIVLQGNTLFAEGVFVPAHQRGIGFVPQEGALFPHLNVADNIAWGLDCSREEKRRRVAALMEMVALDATLANHWPHEISGAQRNPPSHRRSAGRGWRSLDPGHSRPDGGAVVCKPGRGDAAGAFRSGRDAVRGLLASG